MEITKREAKRIARYWAKELGLKNKKIKVVISREKAKDFDGNEVEVAAAVRVLERGEPFYFEEDAILENHYDAIEICLFPDIKQLPKYQLHIAIVHELLHIRFPTLDEERILEKTKQFFTK